MEDCIKALVLTGDTALAKSLTGDENVAAIALATKFNSTPLIVPHTLLTLSAEAAAGSTVDVTEMKMTRHVAHILGFAVTENGYAANVAPADSSAAANVTRKAKSTFVANHHLPKGTPLACFCGPPITRATALTLPNVPLLPQSATTTKSNAYAVRAPTIENVDDGTNTILPAFWPFWGIPTGTNGAWLHNGCSPKSTLPHSVEAGKVYPENGAPVGITAVADDSTTFPEEHEGKSLRIVKLGTIL